MMVYLVEDGQIGTALLAALHALLGRDRVARPDSLSRARAGDLIIAAIDGCNLDRLERWEQIARKRNVHLLCVHVYGGEVVIGPEVSPLDPGCLRCWSTRYYSGRRSARLFGEAASLGGTPSPRDPWLTPLAASIISQITAQRTLDILNRLGEPRGARPWMVYYWSLQTLTGREWRLLPDPSCPHCGRAPFDTAESASVRLTSRPKLDADADRLRNTGELRDVESLYVGRRSGIVPGESTMWRFGHDTVVTVGVPLEDEESPEPCSGFCDRYSAAGTVAVLEAIERYSSVRPRARSTAIHATVASLGDLAVDPRSFGLHSEREYAANPDILTPYANDLKLEFVWGYSFKRQKPVLVPRQLAFYSSGIQAEPRFVIEGSVGCSLGSCAEECILHGIFEVMERDAFLLTWYARRKRPQFDPMESRDPEARHRCRRLKADGFDVIGLDLTTDFGIPAVGLVARSRELKMPYAFCIAAAHIRPDRALRKAVRELGGVMSRYTEELNHEETRVRAASLVKNPSRVRDMMDHVLFYCAPESRHHLDFLTNTGERTSIREMETRSRDLWSEDLSEELRLTIDRIVQAGADVVVVDQTTPEQYPSQLHTYKVLIPGAIPMSWGEHMRRLEGLERLERALKDEAAQCNSTLEPNPAPHAFP